MGVYCNNTHSDLIETHKTTQTVIRQLIFLLIVLCEVRVSTFADDRDLVSCSGTRLQGFMCTTGCSL